MVDGDVESSKAVTHTRIAVTQNDGSVVIKHVLESLDTPPQISMAPSKQLDVLPNNDDTIFNDMPNMSPPPSAPPRTYRVSVSLKQIKMNNMELFSDTKRLHIGICFTH